MIKPVKKKKVANIKYARAGEYRRVIEEIVSKGKCPFCPDNFRYHKNPTIRRNGGWLITKSGWPYENSRHHLIIISKRHVEDLAELTIEDLTAIKELADWAVRRFGIKGGALAIRFGDTDYTGATVCHLHFHLIAPQKSKTVNFPVG